MPILFSSLGSGDSAALLNAVVIGVGAWPCGLLVIRGAGREAVPSSGRSAQTICPVIVHLRLSSPPAETHVPNALVFHVQ